MRVSQGYAVALAAMEEYSGAYMRLLHNVFRVDEANIVLASNMRTALVAPLRDLAPSSLYCVLACKPLIPLRSRLSTALSLADDLHKE